MSSSSRPSASSRPSGFRVLSRAVLIACLAVTVLAGDLGFAPRALAQPASAPEQATPEPAQPSPKPDGQPGKPAPEERWRLDAPFAPVPPGAEIVERRLLNAKTYATDNPEEFKTVFELVPIHYEGPDGRLVDVDNRLVAGANGRYRNAANSMRLDVASAFDDRQLVKLTTPDGQASLAYHLAGARPGSASPSAESIAYRGILPGVDLELTSLHLGYKEELVLHSRNAPDTYFFPLTLDGLTAEVEDGRDIVFRDAAGDERARMPSGYMEDANVHPSGAGPRSYGVAYELVPWAGGGTAIRMTLDRSWLDDPARKYPVRVDPETWMDDLYWKADDTYITTGVTRNNSVDWDLRVGTFDGGATKNRSYLRFTPLDQLRYKRINGASLWVYEVYSYSCTKAQMRYHNVTQAWDGATMTGYPGASFFSSSFAAADFAMGFSSSCPAGWSTVEARDAVYNWTHDIWQNLGILLKAGDENNNLGYKRFRSTNNPSNSPNLRPTLAVGWEENTPPWVPDTPTPANGAKLTTIPTELSTRYVDDDGDRGRIEIEVYDAAGVRRCSATSWNEPLSLNRGNVSCPGLPEGKYTWRARAKDIGSAYSAWSPTWSFTADPTAPLPPSVTSDTHTNGAWSKNDSPTFRWSASDSSGISNYSYLLSTTSTAQPDTVGEGTGTTKSYLALAEGDHYFTVRAQNGLSTWGSPNSPAFRVRVDKTKPTSSTGPTSSHAVGVPGPRTVSVQWQPASDALSGVAGYSTSFSLSPASDADESIDTPGTTASQTLPSDGTWYFHVRAVDQAGNAGDPLTYGPVVIDGTAPEPVVIVSSSHPDSTAWSNQRQARFDWAPPADASGIAGYAVAFDTAPATDPGTTVETTDTFSNETATTDGQWWMHVRAQDRAGNWSDPAHYGILVDASPSDAISIASSTHPTEDGWYAKDDPKFSWTEPAEVSPVSGYSYVLDQQSDTRPDTESEGMGTETEFTDVASGDWWFHVAARDGAGNWGTPGHYRVRVDVVPPVEPATITGSHAPGVASADRTVDVGWTPGIDTPSGVAGYSYEFNRSRHVAADTTLDIAGTTTTSGPLDDGIWYFHVRTVDRAGNASPDADYGPIVISAAAPAGLGFEAWWPFVGTPLGPQAQASVNVANGNLAVQHVDGTPIQAHGDLAYVLRRTYNSQDTTFAWRPGSIGTGWRLNVAETGGLASDGLTATGIEIPEGESAIAPRDLTVVDRDGTRHVFEANADGVVVDVGSIVDGPLQTLVPRVLSLDGSPGAHLCVDQTYKAPQGVQLGLWRYLQVTSSDASDPCGTPDAGTTPVVIGFAAVRPDRLRQEFDADGRLLSIVDANGVELRYRYEDVANVGSVLTAVFETRSCADPGVSTCRAFRFAYPDRHIGGTTYHGRQVDVTDPAGRLTTYLLDDHATTPRLVRVENPDGTSLDYTYGSCGGAVTQLCSVTDPRGHETTFSYGSESTPRVATVTDRRGTATSLTYVAGATTIDRAGQRRRFSEIDEHGRARRLEEGSSSAWLRTTTFDWDTAGDTCRQPDGVVDNNLCGTTRAETGMPAEESRFVYNSEGRPLVSAGENGAADAVRTSGYRAQYVQADGPTRVYEDTVVGSGAVVSTGPASGRSDGQTLFAVSDTTQDLTPRGNAAGPAFAPFLTTYDVDADAGVAPNGVPPGSTCVVGAPRRNTGNLCQVTSPSSDGTGPSVTRYTYDAFGQRATMTTPKATAETPSGQQPPSFSYTYFGDGDVDLSGLVSAGGWLRAVTDTSGNFVAFGYDRAGNVVRTWDRKATDGRSLGEFPGTAAAPPVATYTEDLYGVGSTALSSPGRYLRSHRDQLGHTTTYTPDANGNVERARPPRGNAAGSAAFDVVQTFDHADLLTSRLLPEEAATGAATTYGYDALGNPTSSTDPEGHVRTVRYDAIDRQTTESWTRGAWDPATAPPSCRTSAGGDAPIPAGRVLCERTTAYGAGSISHTDGNGKTATFEYDALRREVRRHVPRNDGTFTVLRTDTVYDEDGNVRRSCPPRQFTEGADGCLEGALFSTHHTYDAAGNVATTTRYRTSGEPLTTSHSYDADRNLVEATNANGRTTAAAFDLLGRKTSTTTPRGTGEAHTTTWRYDDSGNVTAVVRPGPGIGLVTAYDYDDAHRLVQTVEGADALDAAQAGPVSADGGSNVRSAMAYDADGNVVARFDPRAFASSTATPDPRFMTRTDIDANGRPVARYTPRYDGSAASDPVVAAAQAGQCPTGVTPVAAPGVPAYPSDVGVCTSRATYDRAGRVAEVRLATSNGADNRYTVMRYSDDGLLVEMETPSPSNPGARVVSASYRYDGEGQEIRAADALGHSTSTEYTDDGRVARVVGQATATTTHETRYRYDGGGNLTATTDAEGHTSTSSFYADDLVRDMVDGKGNRTSYVYDAVGNPTQVFSPSANARDATNPSGTPTVNTFTFDNLLETSTQPVAGDGSLRRRTAYDYDPAGRKESQTVTLVDAAGSFVGDGGTQSFSWLPTDRIGTETGREGETITTAYDAAGNPTAVADSSDGGSTIATSYYLDGLVRTVDDGPRTTRHAYDGAGQRVARADVTDSTGAVETTTYAYGDAGLPTTMTAAPAGPGAWSWSYDDAGRPETETAPNGQQTSWTFDVDDTLTAVELKTSTGTRLARHGYTYDNLGRIRTQTFDGQGAGGAQPLDATFTYTYDDAGRLSSFNDGSSVKPVEWDADGNRLRYGDKRFTYTADDAIDAEVDAAGNVVHNYVYDAAGRLENDGCGSFQYDGFDRTDRATRVALENEDDDCTESGSIAFFYDALDRRRASGDLTFHYDGLSDSTLVEAGPTGVGTYVLGPDGGAKAFRHAEQGQTTVEHLATEGQGSIATVTRVDATVACTVRYDAFGDTVGTSTPPANPACSTGDTKNGLFYRGARRDGLTSTYQFGSRTYDPAKAAWLTPDSYRAAAAGQDLSVGVDPLTANRYTYVNGDPVNLWDPSGHALCSYVSDGDAQLRCFRNEQKPVKMMVVTVDGEEHHLSEIRAAEINAANGGSANCALGPNGEITVWNDEADGCGVWITVHSRSLRQQFANAAGGVLNGLSGGNAKTILSWTGAEDKVDYNSPEFRTMDTATQIADLALGVGAAVKTLRALKGAVKARKAAKLTSEAFDAVDNRAGKMLSSGSKPARSAGADLCRTNSFVPATLVLMADGSAKPIEDVRIGDTVLAADPETGERGPRRVTDTIVGDGVKELVDVEVDGHVVTATDRHPFWVDDDGRWVDAEDLTAGDTLLLATGASVEVDAVRLRTEVRRVHNLTVDGVHTYHVLAGDDAVLVHNCAKKSPNPYGRAGGPAHRSGIDEVVADIEARGLTAQTEYRVRTPGGFRENRYADVGAFDPSDTDFLHPLELHQVGRATRSGIPVARERRALVDMIRHIDPSVQTYYHPYNV